MRFFRGVDKQGSPTLTEVVGSVVGGLMVLGVPTLVVVFWSSVVSALSSLVGLLGHLRDTIMLEVWQLPALLLFFVAAQFVFWYARLYRYRKDTIFGLDFTWLYSFPMGRVVRVRAFCPVCHKRASEPMWALRCDNYLCRNCGYNTESRGAERMEYPWDSAIQRRVNARLQRLDSV